VQDAADKVVGRRLAYAGVGIGCIGMIALGAWVGSPVAIPMAGAAIWGAMLGACVLVAFGMNRVFAD
jgi:hypothetical protein